MAISRIRVALGNQPLGQRDHFRDVLGCHGLNRWGQGTQRRHIFTILRRKLLAHSLNTAAPFQGRLNNFVVDIGDVARIHHGRVLRPQ